MNESNFQSEPIGPGGLLSDETTRASAELPGQAIQANREGIRALATLPESGVYLLRSGAADIAQQHEVFGASIEGLQKLREAGTTPDGQRVRRGVYTETESPDARDIWLVTDPQTGETLATTEQPEDLVLPNPTIDVRS